MKKSSQCVYHDGDVKQLELHQINDLFPSNLSGTGVFETMRFEFGRIFLYKRHLNRLTRSLTFYRIENPFEKLNVINLSKKLCTLNGLDRARLRLVVWKEFGQIHFYLMTFPLDLPTLKKMKTGYRLARATSVYIKRYDSHLKSIDYSYYENQYRKAKDKGYDEVLICNQHSEMVEGARNNIFFRKKNKLYTPSLATGCLAGIARGWIIDRARKLGIVVLRGKYSVKVLEEADEVFLSNSVGGIMPVTRFGNKLLKKDVQFSLADRFAKEFDQLVKD